MTVESPISNYTLPELFEAFETVDDISYPQRSLALIKQIMSLTQLSIEQLIEKYQSGNLLSDIALTLIIPDLSCDDSQVNQQTIAKLNRLSNYL